MALMKPNPETMLQVQAMVEQHLEQGQTTVDLLERIANESGDGYQSLAITEVELPGGIEVDFPVKGSTRWLIPRLATGGKFSVPTELVSLLPANNRRLGGTIVNSGATDMELVLASPANAASNSGLARVWLGKDGGSWDFRLGSLLWCGSVCAIAFEEATTATVAEV